MNFNVRDFEQLYNKINEWKSKISSGMSNLVTTSRSLSEILASEDSTMSEQTINLGSTINTFGNKLISVLDQIEQGLKEYEMSTISNEQKMANATSAVNSSLSNLANMLDSI